MRRTSGGSPTEYVTCLKNQLERVLTVVSVTSQRAESDEELLEVDGTGLVSVKHREQALVGQVSPPEVLHDLSSKPHNTDAGRETQRTTRQALLPKPSQAASGAPTHGAELDTGNLAVGCALVER